MTTPATGTVYGLIDPRDGILKYIGQTKQRPAVRVRGTYAPRVSAWLTELRTAGLAPSIIHVREGVPVDDLLAAEAEEITRVIAAGGTLLNEQVTALGRKLLNERHAAERKAAEHAAWAEVAGAALAILGGPLPPGDLPLIEIPDETWHFISTGGPARLEHAESLFRGVSWREVPSEHYALQQAVQREREAAAERVWDCARHAWSAVRGAGGDSFDSCLERNTRAVLNASCDRREDASRFVALAVWYTVAVHPWRHLAELAGLPLDDASFTAWAGRDEEVREALAFLVGYGDWVLDRLSIREHCPQHEKAPGRLLGAVVAAHSDMEPPEIIRSDLAITLGDLAGDHMLTQPMADLFLRLNPRAVDSVFGRDVAAEIDCDLGLPPGTSGQVLRALGGKVGHIDHGPVRRAIDRSAQALPVTALPDYRGWYGPSILSARVISGSLVRASLAAPERMTAEEYLAEVRSLWTPRRTDRRQLAA
jgi:hypothetical protein